MADTESTHKTRTLIGFAVDVSASMQQSIRNDSDRSLSRFESFQKSFGEFLKKIAKRYRHNQLAGFDEEIDIFVYCFGIKEIAVCDLLAFVEFGNNYNKKTTSDSLNKQYSSIDPYEQLEEIARKHELSGWGYRIKRNDILSFDEAQRLVNIFSLYPSLESEIARMIPKNSLIEDAADRNIFGLYNNRNRIGESMRDLGKLREAENRIKMLVTLKPNELIDQIGESPTLLSEVFRNISRETKKLSIKDIKDLPEKQDLLMDLAKTFFFADTPMKQAMMIIKNRFKKEMDLKYNRCLLFVVSDGESTDGDPYEESEQLKSLGVTIFSCFITDDNITKPKTLYSAEQENWDTGASTMFKISSHMTSDDIINENLLRSGWNMEKNSKLFVQINHSSVLDAVIRLANPVFLIENDI